MLFTIHTVTCSIHGEMRMYTKLCLEVFVGRNQWGIWYRWDIYIFLGLSFVNMAVNMLLPKM
jgi:hypothetical protein